MLSEWPEIPFSRFLQKRRSTWLKSLTAPPPRSQISAVKQCSAHSWIVRGARDVSSWEDHVVVLRKVGQCIAGNQPHVLDDLEKQMPCEILHRALTACKKAELIINKICFMTAESNVVKRRAN